MELWRAWSSLSHGNQLANTGSANSSVLCEAATTAGKIYLSLHHFPISTLACKSSLMCISPQLLKPTKIAAAKLDHETDNVARRKTQTKTLTVTYSDWKKEHVILWHFAKTYWICSVFPLLTCGGIQSLSLEHDLFFRQMTSQLNAAELHAWDRGLWSRNLTLNNGPPQHHVDKTGRKHTVRIYLTTRMRRSSLLSRWAAARRKMCVSLQPPPETISHGASLLWNPACVEAALRQDFYLMTPQTDKMESSTDLIIHILNFKCKNEIKAELLNACLYVFCQIYYMINDGVINWVCMISFG